MKIIYFKLLGLIFFSFLAFITYAQEKPIELSIGSIKTELKNKAIDFGIKYVESIDSLISRKGIFLGGKKSLFQASPEINVQSGTDDAFSSIDVKLQGLFIFFKTKTVAGVITPCSDCLFHTLPLAAGVETNNSFNVINGILEVGYVPWYQSMQKVPKLIKSTKIGVFVQGGQKFDWNNGGNAPVGGELDESKEKIDEAIFRLKGTFSMDTKNLFPKSWVGLVGSTDGWYDILNKEIYYTLSGKLRFYLSSNKKRFFDFKYQKGSGAPNFNQGDQYGMGLTVTF
ncbi:hypothetical protein GM921_13690 [Pedobacter sp. LMG 31464]|uniref:Uncharacterized protein n=1 Tax=Pedobacter planticolens TaxID=2679964 RepID=A0A923IV06_9SPHI|nr:hypothetical protein [Pedobacter planticolens]MBB2146550.1 hypothetical protein [Pedobacter planticolens]